MKKHTPREHKEMMAGFYHACTLSSKETIMILMKCNDPGITNHISFSINHSFGMIYEYSE